MQIVEVIPIARGVLAETLTYFTTKDLAPGAVVTVPVKRRLVPALVVSGQPVSNIKTAIKNAEFSLKKIGAVRHQHFFDPDFVAVVLQTAKYFVGSPGQILTHFTTQAVLELPGGENKEPTTVTASNIKSEKLALQDTDIDRIAFYKGLIRSEFAKKSSVFLCQPTVADIERTISSLERGIEEYTVGLHHGLNIKELQQAWSTALNETHPILIVATPSYLCLPRLDVKTLIVDQESSGAYKERTRPYTDARTFAEFLATQRKMKLIFGDVCLRTETLARLNNHELLPAAPLRKRFVTTANCRLSLVGKKEALSEQTKDLLNKARENNEKTFVLCNRRGLNPVVACDDCGQLVLCHNCRAPVVLHEQHMMVCHHCGAKRAADKKCVNCRGWRLSALGTGIERVAAEISQLFPKQPLLHLDSDRVKTATKAREIVKRFYQNPGNILLGTELALYYLIDKFENAALVGLDSLLSVPDFRIEEKILNLGLRVRQFTTKNFLVQTRSPDSPLLSDVAKGDFLNFHHRQIDDRKRFGYPPFKFYIKVTGSNNKETAEILKQLENAQKIHQPAIFPSLNNKLLHLLLRLEPNSWPNSPLAEALQQLPLSLTVTVDPESVM